MNRGNPSADQRNTAPAGRIWWCDDKDMSGDYNSAMAKAKKSEGSKGAAQAKKRSTAAKPGRGKQNAATSGAGGSPLVDTSLAAQTAAKMLLARAASGGGQAGGSRAESSTFKNLKESVQKPHLQGMNNLLNSTAPPAAKRSNLPFGQKQVGHNQTFGADVNRAGVPRRTGG